MSSKISWQWSNNFMFIWPCIITNCFIIKSKHPLISQIYFCQEILHVSGSSSVHRQEFIHCTLGTGMSCRFDESFQARPRWNSVPSWSCLKAVVKTAWHITVPNVQWKTPNDGQKNCPKFVEFLDKNKFGKLVRVLVLLKIIMVY